MRLENLLWGGVLVFLMSIPLVNNDYYYYFVFCILVGLGIIEKCVYPRRTICKSKSACVAKKSNKVSMSPLIMIVIWGMGIIIGLLEGNPYQYIVRNLAGTVCYALYYVLAFRKPVEKQIIVTALYRASVIATLFTAIAFILRKYGISVWPFSNATYMPWSNTIITSVEALTFVLEAICLWKILGTRSLWRKKIKYIFLFLLASWVLLFTNTMGGYKLGYIAIFGVVLFFAVFYNPMYRQREKFLGGLIFVVLGILIILYDLNSSNIIGQIFSLEDAGNTKRYLQIEVVLDRLKLFGNGLGSVIEYTWNGKLYDGYAVEVSYLNILDKYGLLSIFVLFVYAQTWILAFKGLIKKSENSELYIMAIGACGYMFVAIGNPVLFSAYNVILHSMILYLLTHGEVGVRLHE